jgi:hypothetical protein
LHDGNSVQLHQALWRGQALVTQHRIHAFEVRQHHQLLKSGSVTHVASRAGVGLPPLSRGAAKQGDIEQVGFACVNGSGLNRRQAWWNQLLLNGARMDLVVNLGQSALKAPFQLDGAGFFILETLKFLNEVGLELGTQPRSKLEGNISVSVSTTASSRLGIKADSPGGINPFFGREREVVQTCLAFKPIEFERFKFGVVQLLPDTQELDRVPVAQPVVKNALIAKVPEHVGQGDEILLMAPST